MIRLNQITFDQANFQFRCPHLHLEKPQRTFVTGPSGGGKTTLLRLISGLAQPTGGSIHLCGKTVFDHRKTLPPHQRGLMLLQQNFGLWPHLSAAQHLGFVLSGGKNTNITPQVVDLLTQVNLDHRLHALPQDLSGGEQQRLALARIIARQPNILLLDEPFSSIDAVLREALQKVLQQLHQPHMISLQVSHDRHEIQRFADWVMILEDGKITQQGTWDAITTHPGSAWIERWVGLTE